MYAALAVCVSLAVASPTRVPAVGERSGTVTFTIDVAAPPGARVVKLWFPYPASSAEQTIERLRFDGNYSSFSLAREPLSGALYLYVQWAQPMARRRLVVAFHARARSASAVDLVERGGEFPPEVRRYLEASFWLPANDPAVKETAAAIVAGKRGVLARARAIYDWTLENLRRDPAVPGCGLGKVEVTLASRSGKCADISSVFVALARAAGIPSREVFGLLLGRRGQGDVTDGHHCWAEFHLAGAGWVPVDPAGLQKEALARGLDARAEGARPLRDRYFGAIDGGRIVLHRGGRGLSFPEGNAGKVNYFMYPYCEVDGRPLDYCRPRTFAYSIRFEED